VSRPFGHDQHKIREIYELVGQAAAGYISIIKEDKVERCGEDISVDQPTLKSEPQGGISEEANFQCHTLPTPPIFFCPRTIRDSQTRSFQFASINRLWDTINYA
jgi:hypothetical protein